MYKFITFVILPCLWDAWLAVGMRPYVRGGPCYPICIALASIPFLPARVRYGMAQHDTARLDTARPNTKGQVRPRHGTAHLKHSHRNGGP